MRKMLLILLACVLVAAIIGAQFVTLFVVQPIGALPEGRTVVIYRLNNLNFVDSADAFCARKMGGVSLLCRGIVIGQVAKQDNIIARLPYSKALYDISTGGVSYEN